MKTFVRTARIFGASMLVVTMLNANSATTDLANAPLITSPTSSVLPNVFLMLDDSGSMAWDYMPDNAGNFGNGTYGAASSQCNGVFYDPNITYSPPVDSTGSSYPNASFTAAWNDGYKTSSGTTDLSTSFRPTGGTAAPAYYFKYVGTQTTEKLKDYYNTSSTFYTECNTTATGAKITIGGSSTTARSATSVTVGGVELLSATTATTTSTTTLASYIAANINAKTATTGYHATVSSSVVTIWAKSTSDASVLPVVTLSGGGLTATATAFPASIKFIHTLVTATSSPSAGDERTNFANWWSYYHTRMLTMKTATGRAFSSIGPTFRVGLASINNNTNSYTSINSSNTLLELAPFDTTQKANWYGKLYGVATGNSTPLREALSDVGRMYAHKLPASNSNSALTSGLADPIQFSCQQNFTILTTDGFWNGSTTYKLDGATVGNQDYFEPRAMYDGSNVVSTTTTPYTTVQQRQRVTSGVVTTKTWTGRIESVGAACSTPDVVPSNTVSAPMVDGSSSYKVALGLSATDPDPGYCYNLGGSGTGTAWACRSHTTSTNPVVSSATVTDSTNKPWYLVQRTSTLASPCIHDEILFNNTSHSKRSGVCPGTLGVTGSYVVNTPYTLLETISGATSTSIDNYTATQQTTQTTTNGIVGATSALTPSTLTYTFTNNVSTSSTPATSDVFGSWVAGTATSVCTATASLPTSSSTWYWSSPQYTTSSTAGTTVTTILSTVGPTAGTPTTVTSSSGGTSNTLADVAEYYYITDLRTVALGNNISGANGTDISTNNVPSSGLDAASHQHMTTFTLGLGARGRMVFDSAYESATTGDFYAVKQGSTANSTSGVCTWQANNTTCNWPTPASDAIENIDDLWHAAVNGRGTYFSAANPTGLSTALSSALAGVSARTGSAAAATTSNAFVTQGDNFLFRSTFVSLQWTGELIRQQLDITTGAVLSTVDWSAQSQLDANTSRNIYFFDTASTNNLSSFTLTNLTSAGLNGYFTSSYISSLSQLCGGVAAPCLPSWTASTSYGAGAVYKNASTSTWYKVNTAYTSGATFGATDTSNSSVYDIGGTNLINFIRGDRSNEGAYTDTTKFYRQRNHVLGDIVNSETTYVKGALSPGYTDPGYSGFVSTVANRQAMVYVGANDGMLHAFYATDGRMSTTTGDVVSSGGVVVTGGQEAWGFIPTAVMPNLYRLADKSYSSSDVYHRYFVDGSPVTGDVCISNCASTFAVWKTILVGGLNAGGTSYYALDITNPAVPKAIWQFTTGDMGYTFGNPKIVKLKDGTWVVIVTSGYNNTSGDGQGHLYILNAYTGALIRTIDTGVGSVATPSGLGKLDAPLVTPGVDATATAVYAGDMLGNLWRFDINGDLGATGYEAQLLATFTGPSGNVQPITTKPLISLVDTTPIVLVGTGRYLGSTDLADTSQQSFYVLKDTALTDSPQISTTPSVAIYGNPRTYSGSHGAFVQQTLTTTTCPVGSSASICTSGQSVVTASNNTVNYASKSGWYVDFPLSGERVSVDPAIIDRTLVVNTNDPNASSCSVGGDSYQYQFNYSTGGQVSASPSGVVAVKIGNEISTRAVIATLSSGVNKAYTQGSGGGTPTSSTVWSNITGGNEATVNGFPNRKSWRQLIRQ